jgi:hypothetical protein
MHHNCGVTKHLELSRKLQQQPPQSFNLQVQYGDPGRGSSTRDSERWIKWVLGEELLSLNRLSVEGLWGGVLYWGPQKICYHIADR